VLDCFNESQTTFNVFHSAHPSYFVLMFSWLVHNSRIVTLTFMLSFTVQSAVCRMRICHQNR